MSGDQLALFLDPNRAGYHPGQQLTVSVLWAFAVAPSALEVRLFWTTRGKGTQDVEVVTRIPVPAPAAAGEHAIPFTLPAGPWSFSGKLISLGWGLEVVAEPGGQNARCEFVLGPNAQEVLLSPIDDAARA